MRTAVVACNACTLLPCTPDAMAKFVVTVKLDFWNVGAVSTAGYLSYDWGFSGVAEMLNRNGGVRWGWQSKGAIIGFRDGLDMFDFERFPSETYGGTVAGDCSRAGVRLRRAAAIQETCRERGCVLEFAREGIKCATMSQRRAYAINDIGTDILRGDYGRFMRQTDVAASVGWFNQPPFDIPNDQIYGRFARGFADATDAAATIGLQLDKGLWGGLPMPRAERQFTIRVAWLALGGAGSFTIGYDSHDPGNQRTLSVDYESSSEWREVCWRVQAPRFGQSPGGNDVWLTNADSVGELFDSVEVVETPNWEESIAVHQNGCDVYDVDGNHVRENSKHIGRDSRAETMATRRSRAPA